MLLSIITINYNNKNGLENTISSILHQRFRDFEHIIIDGGSLDGSMDVINQHGNELAYWVSEPDRGVYHAMNKGISVAKGDYLLFLNSGDSLCDPSVLDKFFLENPTHDIIYANLYVHEKKKSFVKRYPDALDFEYMMRDTIPHPATIISRNLFISVGLYDEGLKIVSDWKFWIVSLFKHNASYKHLDFVAANFYADGISANPKNRHLVISERHRVFWEYFPETSNDPSGTLNRMRRKIKKSYILKFFMALGFLSWLKDA